MNKISSLFCLLISLCVSVNANAQQFRPAKSADIYKQLQQLQRMGTVMYIAAHPDDENTRLISYLVHHDHINTIYLSLTRGDGGQNIIGNEQGAALGLIRTNEMMMARRLDGGKQLFTRFVDFGFTKSPEETFSFWNKQEVVNDIKNAIQQYKPDVLICRFPTTGEGGHGQHTASAIAALEAFKQIQASKDKNIWKPKRILFNAFKFGTMSTIKDGQFELETNQFDPILGEAYGELAGRSRSEHKSQGAGTPQSFGISNENFELMAGTPLSTSLYDGIDTTWNRIGLAEIGIDISKIIADYDFNEPQKSVTALLALRAKLFANAKDSFWLKQKINELNQITLSCAGIQVEVLSAEPTTLLRTNLDVNINAISRYPKVKIITLKDSYGNTLVSDVNLETDKTWTNKSRVFVPDYSGITQPYWLQEESKDNKFVYPGAYTNEPLSNNNFTVAALVSIDGIYFPFNIPVSYKKLDPTRGDVIEAARIMPEVDLEPAPSSVTIQKGESFHASASIFARTAIQNANLEIVDAKGTILATVKDLNFSKNERRLVQALVPSNALNTKENPSKILYRLIANGKTFDKQLHLIQYPHIPTLQYFTTASSNVLVEEWSSKAKNIGYIAGAGDKVAESLSELGLNVTMLSLNDLSSVNNLKHFDAIVCGVRLANTRKDIEKYLPELWKYIEQGGNVVMQYNTSMGLELPNFSPLSIDLSRSRVTDENATVKFTDNNASILKTPNKISSKDFENWVQERGVYYPGKWDNAFKTALTMSDADESPLESGILYAQVGKGYFVYTTLAFFRQLPAGNPGAIKLFLNLLSIGK